MYINCFHYLYALLIIYHKDLYFHFEIFIFLLGYDLFGIIISKVKD